MQAFKLMEAEVARQEAAEQDAARRELEEKRKAAAAGRRSPAGKNMWANLYSAVCSKWSRDGSRRKPRTKQQLIPAKLEPWIKVPPAAAHPHRVRQDTTL